MLRTFAISIFFQQVRAVFVAAGHVFQFRELSGACTKRKVNYTKTIQSKGATACCFAVTP
jgi:hypothetical protein